MLQPKKIAQNTIYYITGLVIQKILAFVYFAYLARVLGPEDTGKYIFALSFTTIFSIFIDLGLSPVLIREIAKEKRGAQETLSNVLAVKIPLALIVYLVVIAFINLLNYPPITKYLVYLSGLVMVFDAFTLSFWGVLRAHQNLKYESLGNIFFQIVLVSLGVIVLITSKNLVLLMAAMLAASVFNFLFSLSLLTLKLKIFPVIKFNRKLAGTLLKIALPFALAGIFVRVYSYLDSVLLSLLSSDQAVGLYGVSYKIIFALQFIPLAFVAAIYPAMSTYFVTSGKFLAKIFERATFYLMIIALPMSVGIFLLSHQIILKIYGPDFLPSIISLQILVTSLLFVFLNFPVGSMLNACNRQTTNTINMGITMILSVVLNLILIPRYSFIGASITYLISSIFLYFLGLYWIQKITPYDKIFLLQGLRKTVMASGVMAVVILFFKSSLSLFVLIPLAAIIYFTLMFILQGLTRNDLLNVYNVLLKNEKDTASNN